MALSGPLKLAGGDEALTQIEEERQQYKLKVQAEQEALKARIKSMKDLKPRHVDIVRALYGAEKRWVNVTRPVQARTSHYRHIWLGRYNDLGGDPIEGVDKILKIEYKIDGKPGKAEFPEDAEVLLPLP